MPPTYLSLVRNYNLEIWIAGSSGRPQLAYTSYKVTFLLISLWFSVPPLRKVYNFGKRVGRISVEFPKTSLALRVNKERNFLAKQQNPLAPGKFRLAKQHISRGALLLIYFVAVTARL